MALSVPLSETNAPSSDARLPAALPFWARACDFWAVALLLVAVGLLIGGRILLSLGPLRLSFGAVERPLSAAVLLVALRHWRHPRPSLPVRAWLAQRTFWGDPLMRSLSAQYWSIRLATLLVGFLAISGFGMAHPGPFRVSSSELANLPARWDAGWYLTIATEGYRPVSGDRQQNLAFFPAFPTLMRVAGSIAGVDQVRMRRLGDGPDRARLLWTGVVLSLLLGWVASIYVWQLARGWIGPERAVTAAVLLHAYPFALFYGAPYTEALYLASSAGAVLFFLRGSWACAAAWGLVAGITRPNGFTLAVPLALLWLESWRRRDGRIERAAWKGGLLPLVAVAAPGLSMLAFSWLVYEMTGNPFRWAELHGAWGREYRSILSLAESYYGLVRDQGVLGFTANAPVDAMNLAAAIFALVAIVPVWRTLGPAYAAFIAVTVIPPLTMGGVMSMGRITATVFPLFVWLAASTAVTAQRSLLLGGMALQGLAAALFFTWRPLF